MADRDKPKGVKLARQLAEHGFEIVSTSGTARSLEEAGITVTKIQKVQAGRPNVIDLMKNDEVMLIVNTPSGQRSRSDESKIRKEAVARGVPCITTMSAAEAAIVAMEVMRERSLDVVPLQEWYAARSNQRTNQLAPRIHTG